MKKLLIIISMAILIIPFFPMIETHASSIKDQQTPGTINNVKQKAIFYAVSEKSGIQFSGQNGGANNFFDALRQSNYELYKNDNKKLTKNGETPKQRFEKVAKEFTQTPTKVRPGVGKIMLSSVAFSYVSELVLNSFETWAYGLSHSIQIKKLDKFYAENTAGQPPMSEIPGLLWFTTYEIINSGYPDKQAIVHRLEPDGSEYKISVGYHYVPETLVTEIRFEGYSQSSSKKWYADFMAIARGAEYNNPNKIYNGTRSISIPKTQFDEYVNDKPVVALSEPKSLGTLNPPSWNTGDETSLPGFIELEVPITEEGEIDLDRQLSPDNPAVNDPTKAPKAPTEIPDYTTIPEKGDDPTKKPGPILTPKPNPDGSPLPQPDPLPTPESAPTEPATPPATDDPPVTNPGDTQNRWGKLVTTKFPFSLPWDIANMISPLTADPVRPSVKVDKSFDVFGKEVPIRFSHNFAWMDDYIVYFRTFILIGFNIFLITGTRKLMGGGQ